MMGPSHYVNPLRRCVFSSRDGGGRGEEEGIFVVQRRPATQEGILLRERIVFIRRSPFGLDGCVPRSFCPSAIHESKLNVFRQRCVAALTERDGRDISELKSYKEHLPFLSPTHLELGCLNPHLFLKRGIGFSILKFLGGERR